MTIPHATYVVSFPAQPACQTLHSDLFNGLPCLPNPTFGPSQWPTLLFWGSSASREHKDCLSLASKTFLWSGSTSCFQLFLGAFASNGMCFCLQSVCCLARACLLTAESFSVHNGKVCLGTRLTICKQSSSCKCKEASPWIPFTLKGLPSKICMFDDNHILTPIPNPTFPYGFISVWNQVSTKERLV